MSMGTVFQLHSMKILSMQEMPDCILDWFMNMHCKLTGHTQLPHNAFRFGLAVKTQPENSCFSIFISIYELLACHKIPPLPPVTSTDQYYPKTVGGTTNRLWEA